MIISRSPLRITLGGGGTDLPSYYENHEGFLVAAAIDKYVYVNVLRPFTEGIFLKYSEIESTQSVCDVKHRIIREALKLLSLKTPQIEISALADIPAGTGLGSSGSFTTALLKSLFAHYRRNLPQGELAELACHLEINMLGEPIGKQDQYAAVFGGLTEYTFHKDGRVSTRPLDITPNTLNRLDDNLLLFFTGFSRSASDILRVQKVKTVENNSDMIDNLHYVKELGIRSKNALERGDLNLFAEYMHEHWIHKKKRSKGMSNEKIDEVYEVARDCGAIGGKLVGAGGGGFLMFYTESPEALRPAMVSQGMEEVRFSFDFQGTKIIT